MALNFPDRDTLECRLKTLLPEEYQNRVDDVQPVSMGSAGLKYGTDGRVAWDEMWASFCDLALAGGPPHKGTLLKPGSPAEITAHSAQYQQVVAEICRGINLTTSLTAEESPIPGWIRVNCKSHTMADWLLRAITMENVAVRSCEGATLDLPAGPAYRLEKEIKNVITVLAKTCHYWQGHISPAQQRVIAMIFVAMQTESPLVQPALSNEGTQAPLHQYQIDAMEKAVYQATGLRSTGQCYSGWLGLECPDIGTAIWLMRRLVAGNVLARRESTELLVPINPSHDPDGHIVVRQVIRIYGFMGEVQT